MSIELFYSDYMHGEYVMIDLLITLLIGVKIRASWPFLHLTSTNNTFQTIRICLKGMNVAV